MKKWSGGVLIASLFMLLVLRYGVMENALGQTSILSPFYNTSDHLRLNQVGVPNAVQNPENNTEVVSTNSIVSSLFTQRNFSDEEVRSLETWNHLKQLISQAEALPHAVEAIKEAGAAWESLMVSVQEERQLGSVNGSLSHKKKEKQCPYSLHKMNASELGDGSGYKLQIPCGLIQGSSITIIGTPSGLLGNFRIDLTGTPLPGEPDPPVILHYNVRLSGDKITEDPVIVQNTWTIAHDWGAEERCPSPSPENNGKVDELDQCNPIVGKDDKWWFPTSKYSNGSRRPPVALDSAKPRRYFPFKQGYLSVAILRVGPEGIQMTVDGKHITSFAYRESLEPWLVSEVRISGDLDVISVLASGLPTSEDLDHVIDLETLKAAPLPAHKPLDLFVGVFSTANNFKRRMAVRRTWMQYDAVRSGAVAVRFFVGLHKNQLVNEELWNEARTYADTQLMPFVDYYNLITWKTIAICIYGEWPEDTYPPWAHGPGYVVSRDIAKAVYKQHKKRQLKMFKLEDVAMGIWISEMKNQGLDVRYVKDERIHNEGCQDGYVVAHYQEPREMLCLWQKLLEGNGPKCCGG
ncbi:beta-1,3-galactosyltransferase GALT1 isoform X2 [Magnolia sinica]|uniref:beta-1,3-galactosyltransferase GALT1 isoform X2 n=1 Tax=Magnolia sinica TaxID=86752 RepID=UPI002657F233|nr:beta-1,3-galactosyltransferase GALT1 isoform X2 [Magnolia sinica]